MLSSKKLKARIQAWMKEIKTKMKSRAEITEPRFQNGKPIDPREEMRAKYFYISPRNF